eukprot:762474-Hanusia_phi.AAC.4
MTDPVTEEQKFTGKVLVNESSCVLACLHALLSASSLTTSDISAQDSWASRRDTGRFLRKERTD